VHLNRRYRGWSFLAVFLMLASHIWLHQLPAWLYASLTLSFLIWPQLAYARSRHAMNSVQTELNNLIIDSAIFGVWIAGLGYPLWITFILFISTSVNLMAYRGPRGLLQALAGLGVGMATGSLFAGLHFKPETHWLTTTLSVIGSSIYLLLVSYVAFTRNQTLQRARAQQRLTEQELKQQIMENQQLQALLSEQANRDPLTGLYNRRYLDDSLNREMVRCLRHGDPLSLILIDLDHFKKVNDEYGHSAGDQVINQLAMVLTTLSRASDIACRFGGEEFLVVLPGTGLEAAEARAEECRRMFENTPVTVDGSSLLVTLSAGVACSYCELLPDELVRKADQALYRAKAAGRNRVVSLAPWTEESKTV
jgi:diguanylate cyclase (GGDEF)-like protein